MITVYEDSIPTRADELEPGDVVWDGTTGPSGTWREVVTATPVWGEDKIWVKLSGLKNVRLYEADHMWSVATGAPETYDSYREWIMEVTK